MAPIYHTARVRSHPQEMAENVVDSAHFKFVHGTPDIPEKTVTFDGHIMRAFQGLTFTTPTGEIKGSVDIESHGGSVGITRFSGIGDTLIIVTGTPVDSEYHETVMRFSFKIMDGNLKATEGLAKAFIGEVSRQHGQDVPIWEHKKFHQNPVLCDGDPSRHRICPSSMAHQCASSARTCRISSANPAGDLVFALSAATRAPALSASSNSLSASTISSLPAYPI